MDSRFSCFFNFSRLKIITGVMLAFRLSVHAQIFVTSGSGGHIGEYTTAGVTVNATLITGLGNPWGMTSDGSGNLYVANEGSRTVGKYTTSGSTVNGALITVRGDPEGVALDGDGYIYVVDSLTQTVGKYTTSGVAVNSSLITGLSGIGFASIACYGNDLFIGNSGSGSISEYTITGTLVNASLISISDLYAMTCDSNGNLFTTSDGKIGEYTTTGTTVNASLITGLDPRQFGIALDGKGDLFVSSFSAGTIGEYTTSGATVNASLVTGLTEPMGLVVVPEPTSVTLLILSSGLYFYPQKRKRVSTPKSNRNSSRT